MNGSTILSPLQQQALIQLFKQAHAETMRYRDMEWRILVWTVTLLAGVAFATRISGILTVHKEAVKTLLSLFVLVAAIYGGWHIHRVHSRLAWNRQLRLRCEIALDLFSVPANGKPLLDKSDLEQKAGYWSGKGHLVSWWALIGLIALFALYAILTV